MENTMILYYENYTPVGDVLVLAICMVFVALIRTAYINRTKNFLYLKSIIVILFTAAISNITFHMLVNFAGSVPPILIYLTRLIAHMGLLANLVLYVLYMKEPYHLAKETNLLYLRIAVIAFAASFILELVGTFTGFGFRIDTDGTPHEAVNLFPFFYFFYIFLLLFMLLKYRDRVFRQVLIAVCSTTGIAVMIMVIQQFFGQVSFTSATFLFPVFTLLYHLHSNPYDLEIGTVNEKAFEELISSSYQKKEELFLMSLFMHEFDTGGKKYPPEVQMTVRNSVAENFRNATLFQVSSGHMILIAETSRTPDYVIKSRNLYDAFMRAYDQFHLDYKIIFTRTFNKISASNDYLGLLDFIHDNMLQNSFRELNDRDVKSYTEYKSLTRELADITAKNDMHDPRVEVYCQPVYDLRSGLYDTAESLMRLRLPDIGMLMPEDFIPIAEKNKNINTLTRIILSKTCEQIKEFNKNGYSFRRISVNFSAFDVREDDFCTTVEKIILESGIAFDQIAIEITESQNERDFELIKSRINELKGSGIKFYLDDFGTGYSNFERIMELPFDIIKFDRSLVVASGTDKKLKEMVSHLAGMFSDMGYAVLYEGIESEADEQNCISMSARYLQGFRYSKPIPIERLAEYFKKRA